MSSLIAPGVWIVPLDPVREFAANIACYVDNKPHLCTEIGQLYTIGRGHSPCEVCGNRDLYLKVREHPRFCFCPTHWRPVLTPKAGAFNSLLAPVPRIKERA